MTYPTKQSGVLVISLDFELHWGFRDKASSSASSCRLLGAREAVPTMLRLFQEYDVAATWATVGMLFAQSRRQLHQFTPRTRPHYDMPKLGAYGERVGESEADDPFHYAPSLIAQIRNTPRQEIATHTFSHYYCLESGHDELSFADDLRSAVRIARQADIALHSIVFPRNQHHHAYNEILRHQNINCYRGNQIGWMHQASCGREETKRKRVLRLLDSYFNLTGPNTFAWDTVVDRKSGLANVRAHRFLRPVMRDQPLLTSLSSRRTRSMMSHAARHGEIVHLWWHPHNFGRNLSANLRMLRGILNHFAELKQQFGMRSMNMVQVAEQARAARAAA